jgi:hypothetical protein
MPPRRKDAPSRSWVDDVADDGLRAKAEARLAEGAVSDKALRQIATLFDRPGEAYTAAVERQARERQARP